MDFIHICACTLNKTLLDLISNRPQVGSQSLLQIDVLIWMLTFSLSPPSSSLHHHYHHQQQQHHPSHYHNPRHYIAPSSSTTTRTSSSSSSSHRHRYHSCHFSQLSHDTHTETKMSTFSRNSWWRHQMETFCALLALVRGIQRSAMNSPQQGQFYFFILFLFQIYLYRV